MGVARLCEILATNQPLKGDAGNPKLIDFMTTYKRADPWSPICYFFVRASHENGQGRVE